MLRASELRLYVLALFNNKQTSIAKDNSYFCAVMQLKNPINMNRTEVRDALYPDCPIRNILSRVGDKWSMLVLFTLETNGNLRFKELQRNIPDISQKMLTATLKMLEGDALITRVAFPEVPPRVEYSLSAKGKSLLPHISNLLAWATEHMGEIIKSRQRYLLK